MDFPLLIWKYAKHTVFGEGLLQARIHGLENCLMETTSHIKMEFSFPFREKKDKQGQVQGPKLIAPLWSHCQKLRDEDTGSLSLRPDEIQLQSERGFCSSCAFFVPKLLLSWPKINLLSFFDWSARVACTMSHWAFFGSKLGFDGLKLY